MRTLTTRPIGMEEKNFWYPSGSDGIQVAVMVSKWQCWYPLSKWQCWYPSGSGYPSGSVGIQVAVLVSKWQCWYPIGLPLGYAESNCPGIQVVCCHFFNVISLENLPADFAY
jgi:hypothetical protein